MGTSHSHTHKARQMHTGCSEPGLRTCALLFQPECFCGAFTLERDDPFLCHPQPSFCTLMRLGGLGEL